MKLNTLLIFVLFLVISAGLVYANSLIDEVRLYTPANGTYDADGTALFRFNVTGKLIHNYTCTFWSNNSGVWTAGSTLDNATNSTIDSGTIPMTWNVTETGLVDGHTGWTVGCYAAGNSTIHWPINSVDVSVRSNANNTLIVDTTNPVVRVLSPLAYSWNTKGINVQFITNTTEINPSSCRLKTILSEANNETGAVWNISANITSFASDSAITWLFGNKTGYGGWHDNNTDKYIWDVCCNDSAAHTGCSGNYTFWVDSVTPGGPDVTFPLTGALSTDLAPLIKWLNVTGQNENELNFSKYHVVIDDDSAFGSPIFQSNITGKSLNTTRASGLAIDTVYYIRVTTFDLAGNSNSSVSSITYTTDGTCGTLIADTWNICAYVGSTAMNASALCDQTSCSYISIYNKTHQWQTYTAGASVNGKMHFIGPSGTSWINTTQVAFIYVDANQTWANRTREAQITFAQYNLTGTGNGWNILPWYGWNGSTNFTKLDLSINGDGTDFLSNNHTRYMSFFKATNTLGSRYIPYVANWTINNETEIHYGEAFWAHFNTTIESNGWTWNSSGEVS